MSKLYNKPTVKERAKAARVVRRSSNKVIAEARILSAQKRKTAAAKQRARKVDAIMGKPTKHMTKKQRQALEMKNWRRKSTITSLKNSA